MIKVAVFGAKGRMGTAVCQAVEEAEDTELVAAVDSGGDRSDASGA
ncbi:4-hydroxy-tetrahydrodipicolinate reductase, partial [Cutibacterium acnes subsp. acnes]|nr:4-hydroxy-tetrahydrodipicolinate reductase [Cutibacterium acnes subsp. acnes]